jgi:hypothetical protein
VLSQRFLEPYSDVARFHKVTCGFDSSTFSWRDGERDIDVLIHGSMGEDTSRDVYPVRNWLARELPFLEKEGVRVVTMDHPGYMLERQGADFASHYASMLGRSKIAIGGTSRWKLPLKKLYEVPATGAVLLTDLPEEDRGFFEGRVIEVDPEKIGSEGYADAMRESVLDVLSNYGSQRNVLQPFRSDEDRFRRSYYGRALEIRSILSEIS